MLLCTRKGADYGKTFLSQPRNKAPTGIVLFMSLDSFSKLLVILSVSFYPCLAIAIYPCLGIAIEQCFL